MRRSRVTWRSAGSPFLGALGISNVAGVLAIGPATEVLFIVTIPLALKYLGMKWSLLLGMVRCGRSYRRRRCRRAA